MLSRKKSEGGHFCPPPPGEIGLSTKNFGAINFGDNIFDENIFGDIFTNFVEISVRNSLKV